MAVIHETLMVQKRNVLNELHNNNMTLQELRFFSIYLAKIDAKKISTRTVRFPIEDFQRIMGLGRINIKQLKENTDSLLGKKVSIPLESGGYESFVLFEKCKVDKDENNEWYIEISASNSAAPLMFNFKNRFFQYKLWNALSLKSANQIRMYEILKQHEKLGKREWSITELKNLLGIDKSEYSGRTGLNDFKRKVLDSCQQALKENTDICYTYERGKTGTGGKWLSVIFYIFKNEEYKDKLSLEEFIDMQPEPEIIDINAKEECMELSDSVAVDDMLSDENIYIPKNENDNSFIEDTDVQEVELKLLKKLAGYTLKCEKESEIADFIEFCKIKMEKARSKGKIINSPTDYLCTIIENSADEFKKTQLKREEKEQSYDIHEFEKYAVNYEEFKKVNKNDKTFRSECAELPNSVHDSMLAEIMKNEPCNSIEKNINDEKVTQQPKKVVWYRSKCFSGGYWEYLTNKKKTEGDACGFELVDDTVTPYDNSKDGNYDEIDGQLTLL